MPETLNPRSPVRARSTILRVGTLALCIGAAFAAAWLQRAAPVAPVAMVAAAPVQLTPEQILAAMPTSSGPVETQKALGTALGKVRKTAADPVAWVNLGDVLAQMLRDTGEARFYQHAEAAYQEALRLDPKSANAMTGMAWVTGGRHLFDQSIRWAEKALALDARNPAAFGILGDAALELGEYDHAFDHYQRMMDLRPDLSSWSRGAHLLWLTGDKDKAMWLMDRSIKAGAPFAENTAWCRARLAMMEFQDGALAPAAEALGPALAAGSRNPHVLVAAGRIAAAQGDFAAARRHYEKLLEAGPNHDALAALGDLCAQQGEAEAAEKYYAQVEALHAAHLASAVHDHVQMAKFYADHDRNLVEALRLAEQHKLTRNVVEADVLAWVYFKNGDLPRAQEAMQRALSRKTPDAEMQYHAGMIAAAAGDRAAAQRHLEQAVHGNAQFSVLQAPRAAQALAQLGSAGQAVSAAPQNVEPAR